MKAVGGGGIRMAEMRDVDEGMLTARRHAARTCAAADCGTCTRRRVPPKSADPDGGMTTARPAWS